MTMYWQANAGTMNPELVPNGPRSVCGTSGTRLLLGTTPCDLLRPLQFVFGYDSHWSSRALGNYLIMFAYARRLYEGVSQE